MKKAKRRQRTAGNVPIARKRTAQPLTIPPASVRRRYTFLDDFFSNDWSSISPRNGYGAYALSLFANKPDYGEVADEALTEGDDDKDVDLCLIDEDTTSAYIVQSYVGNQWDQHSAPSNKADDLLSALSWLLCTRHSEIPDSLRPKATELQKAISERIIDRIHLLYVHNCRGSKNVLASLKTVEESAQTLLRDKIKVSASELSLPQLERLYTSLTKMIVVEERVSFTLDDFFRESGTNWKGILTTIQGHVLHDLWQKYGDALFSANIRGFLDMLRRKTSVNRGILLTVEQDPEMFWVFNNGVTILSKKLTVRNNRLSAQGVSVINGAQTTGVLGRAPRDSAANVRIPCRFVECNVRETVLQIVENNNTQNEIKSFDLKSNDAVQTRLRGEFADLSIEYVHRREGASKLKAGAVQAEGVAPYLAAFHDKFQIATRQRRAIFEDSRIYTSTFSPDISARHVYLIQCLADAVTSFKNDLRTKVEGQTANESQRKSFEMFRHSTTKLFLVSLVGKLAEQILGKKLPNRFAAKVVQKSITADRAKVVSRWKLVVEAIVPLVAQKGGADIGETMRSAQELPRIAEEVGSIIESLKNQYASQFDAIRSVVAFE